MTTANFNYTNKKVIKRSDFSVVISSDQESFIDGLRVEVRILEKYFSANSTVILDAYSRGTLERKELSKKPIQTANFLEFSTENLPTFRIIVISQDEAGKGKILASTKEFSLQSEKSSPQNPGGFEDEKLFKLLWSPNLGELLWMVDWEDNAKPIFSFSMRLKNIYADIKDPVLQAFMLPMILRETLLGGIVRNDSLTSIESTELGKWFEWVNIALDIKYPDSADFHSADNTISDQWLQFIDEALDEFSKRKWRGNRSMLELLEEKYHA